MTQNHDPILIRLRQIEVDLKAEVEQSEPESSAEHVLTLAHMLAECACEMRIELNRLSALHPQN